MNPGKRWEDNFKKSLGKSCIRLYDTTNGFAGIKNPCDFIYYFYPFQCMFELKSMATHRLPFTDITDNQWEQLTFFSKHYGVIAGICVEYRNENKCYFIPVQELNSLKADDKKSITSEYCKACNVIVEIPAHYSRVNCVIDEKVFKNKITELFNKIKVGGIWYGEN